MDIGDNRRPRVSCIVFMQMHEAKDPPEELDCSNTFGHSKNFLQFLRDTVASSSSHIY